MFLYFIIFIEMTSAILMLYWVILKVILFLKFYDKKTVGRKKRKNKISTKNQYFKTICISYIFRYISLHQGLGIKRTTLVSPMVYHSRGEIDEERLQRPPRPNREGVPWLTPYREPWVGWGHPRGAATWHWKWRATVQIHPRFSSYIRRTWTMWILL